MSPKRVIIVGGGFAGMACARKLVAHPEVHVTLIDKNNYHEFKPLLYQVATAALSTENIASSFRQFFRAQPTINIKMAEVVAVDPHTCTVTTKEGESYQGDFLVLAAGSIANFFDTKGAEQYSFPLYTLLDAKRLRSRVIAMFEAADRCPSLIEQGALNFVIVGAGPTGTELAGSLADLLNKVLPEEFSPSILKLARIYLINHSQTVLGAFSEKSQIYATQVLQKRGVQLKMGELVQEVAADHVVLSSGEKILTHTIIWAGGLKASALSLHCGLPIGHGGRLNVEPDLTLAGFPSLYALGDFANIKDAEGRFLPQLGSVAQQSGYWTARNILAEIKGQPRKPFRYYDKGIMAMIGRNAAVAELGPKRYEIKGNLAFFTWLLVHLALLTSFRQKVIALIDWCWNYFGKTRVLQILDYTEAAHVTWNEPTQPLDQKKSA